MIKIDNDLVLKVIDAMKLHISTEDCVKANTLILDMNKGFLFFNYAAGFLYKGFSMVQRPSYLSSEAQRSSSVFNYTTGFKIVDEEKVYTIAKKRTEDDFKKLLTEIIE